MNYINFIYYSQIVLGFFVLLEVLYLFRTTRPALKVRAYILGTKLKVWVFFEGFISYLYSKVIPGNVRLWHLAAINISILLNSYTLHIFFDVNVVVVAMILFFLEGLILWLRKQKDVKENIFDKNYAEVLSVFSRTYKITSNIQESVSSLSKNLKSKELKKVFENACLLISHGAPFTQALDEVLKPFNSVKSKLFLSLIKINTLRGLNLAYIFGNLSDIESKEKYLQKESRSILYQTRISSVMVALMVPIITLVLMFLSEDYLNVLVNTEGGRILLVFCLIWYGIGVYMINKTLKDAVFKPEYSALNILSTLTNLKIVMFSVSFILSFLLLSWLQTQSFIIKFILVAVVAGVFYSLVDVFLIERIRTKQFKIYINIPHFINYVGVLIESQTFNNIAEVLKEAASNADPDFKDKITGILNSTVEQSSHKVLATLEDSFEDSYMKDLLTTLKLNLEYGGDVSERIYAIAKSAYHDRELKFREAAISGSGKLLIPLMLFHLPVILVLFLVPILLSFDSLL